jgi:hypothetical protein
MVAAVTMKDFLFRSDQSLHHETMQMMRRMGRTCRINLEIATCDALGFMDGLMWWTNERVKEMRTKEMVWR